mmetsp:Transcript_9986/g.9922  ORF Transcript_9986/g.9922 Transcript_9986/m.9922 type:complete len:226 (-) Transcript_9986:423-1100(-)
MLIKNRSRELLLELIHALPDSQVEFILSIYQRNPDAFRQRDEVPKLLEPLLHGQRLVHQVRIVREAPLLHFIIFYSELALFHFIDFIFGVFFINHIGVVQESFHQPIILIDHRVCSQVDLLAELIPKGHAHHIPGFLSSGIFQQKLFIHGPILASGGESSDGFVDVIVGEEVFIEAFDLHVLDDLELVGGGVVAFLFGLTDELGGQAHGVHLRVLSLAQVVLVPQ